MAFANFFDRALMSVAQALSGADRSALEARLAAQVIEIAFDSSAADSAEGQASVDMAVRLLARLYPTLRITSLDRGAKAARPSLEALALAINPELELAGEATATARLVVGASPGRGKTPTVFAGSDGWLAKVSGRGPQGCGPSGLAFGAGAAACLGAANIFRLVFADVLPKAAIDDEAVLSLFDFSTGATATQGPMAATVDLGVTPVAGLGAIGNGLVWALARTPGLTGTLDLIDHEPLELSNLQRYVLALQADIGRVKVEIARQALAAGASKLVVRPFISRWADYVEGRGHPSLTRAVAALDSARDRIEVQAALPGRTLNAWTQAGDLGVSRHDFLGEEACLACLYMPKGKSPNQDELIAQALGLPLAPPILHDIRERLVRGQPVGEEFVRQAAERLGVPAEPLLSFAGEPLLGFYSKAICGGQQLLLEGDQPPVEAPLCFQSALAGIMLAAELVTEAGALRAAPLATKTTIDLTRPLGRRLNTRVAKPSASPGAICICRDRDYAAAYAEIHGLRSPKRKSSRPKQTS